MTESDDDLKFTINKSYAEKYDGWRRKEEYQKLKDKYGEDVLDSSSSSEVEDDDAEEITPEFEKQFLKALASVKSQDPKIYDRAVKFFDSKEEEEEASNSKQDKEKKKKPMYIKDYERKIIVEKDGKYSDEEENSDQDGGQPSSPTYAEEQEQIKNSLQEALKQMDESEEDEDEPFLKKKKKTKEQKEKEEEEYIEWLKGNKEVLQSQDFLEEVKDVDSLRNYWSNPKLDEGEKFLRDYILDKAYKPQGDEEFDNLSDEDLSEDDRLLDEQEDFERKYNFRYEEPDSEFVKSYPRNIAGSMRKKDTSRAKKRQEVKERKEKEKQKLHEELKKLKNLKKMEIMEQLEKLRKVTGNATVGFNEDDIKGDFNPEEHDKMMRKIFDERYDEINDEDESKPVFEDNELEEENWDEWIGNERGYYDDRGYGNDEAEYGTEQVHCEDPGFNMDADYDPELHKKEKKKKKKKKNKRDDSPIDAKMKDVPEDLDGRRARPKHISEFAKALQNKKPVFDPGDKTFEDYFEEYYKLDYEDLIGDLPCRFKYRTVVANDFGLSTEEILGADDKELNRWVSLKRTTQYRTTNEELSDVSSFKQRGKNLQKKQQILASLYAPSEEEVDGEEEQSESKDEKLKEANETEENVQRLNEADVKSEKQKSRTKKKEKRKGKQNEDVFNGRMEQEDGDKDKRQLEGEVGAGNESAREADRVVHGGKVSRKRKLVEEMRNRKRRKAIRRKEISDSRLRAYGVRPKAYKYRMIQQRIKDKRRGKL